MKAKVNIPEFQYSSNRFDDFVDQVIEGNVLLLIGRNFESNRAEFNGDFYDYILRELNNEYGTSAMDFSELASDKKFLNQCPSPYDAVRFLRSKIAYRINCNDYSEDDVNPDLISLIKTGYFRFVFTITFDPLVEIAMRCCFKEVRVMNFFESLNRNINSSSDFKIPTVYYLWGKADANRMFVATDNDALHALHNWSALMNDSALLRYVSDKYILTLGCDYDDWLFRFIWFLLKGGTRDRLSRGLVSRGLAGDYAKPDSLDMYLKRNNILVNNNSSEICGELLSKLAKYDPFNSPLNGADVFISYSRMDSNVADALYSSLTSKGLRVWYDKYDLGGKQGGKFLDLIRDAIEQSVVFVAILSTSISEQAYTQHMYRKEWAWASSLKHGLVAGGNCYAVIASDYDIAKRKYSEYDDVVWLSELDNFVYDPKNLQFDEFAEKIYDKVFKMRRER